MVIEVVDQSADCPEAKAHHGQTARCIVVKVNDRVRQHNGRV